VIHYRIMARRRCLAYNHDLYFARRTGKILKGSLLGT